MCRTGTFRRRKARKGLNPQTKKATLRIRAGCAGTNVTTLKTGKHTIGYTNNGNLQARATDSQNKSTLVSKAYSGAPLRRQVHVFADDFVQALGGKGIAQTNFACKGESGQVSSYCALKRQISTTIPRSAALPRRSRSRAKKASSQRSRSKRFPPRT